MAEHEAHRAPQPEGRAQRPVGHPRQYRREGDAAFAQDGRMNAAHPLPPTNSWGKPAAVRAEKQRTRASAAPICAAEYPHIAAGEYMLRVIEAKTYRDPQFQRYVCRLAFSSPLVHDGVILY